MENRGFFIEERGVADKVRERGGGGREKEGVKGGGEREGWRIMDEGEGVGEGKGRYCMGYWGV